MTLPQFVIDAVYPLAGLAIGALVGVLLRSVVLPRVAKLAEHTETQVDDVVITALRGPVVFWGALIGLYISISLATYEPKIVD
ncbi:MAG: hypothetical protein U9Q74_15545, partial [Gemmatimonadota bacterium]|nr:hypothetical protein [Gemmatimonadota bacterium]